MSTARKETIGGTLLVAFVLCIVCSVIVAGAAVSLKPVQTSNKQLDRKKNILSAAGMFAPGEHGAAEIEELFGRFTVRMVDLDSGEYLSEEQLARPELAGQVYNLVRREYVTWADYHRTAMRVIGREVELVGVPFDTLRALGVPNFGITEEIFAHHVYYSPEKLMRDVPEFRPRVSLEEGMVGVLAAMDRDGRIPDSDAVAWEDEIIRRQLSVVGY